uniref:WW domain-containing protein n=1 Tax=Bionectria ochroleuca TaxID=29856 RepID=A0A8H7K213_BIOOC
MTTHPSWWVKLADFGLSKLNESLTGMITARGILHEIAPEVLGYSGNPSNVDPFLVDMWSLGQIAFRISAGHPMFSSHESLFSYCDGQTPIRESVLRRHAVEENFIQFIKGLAEPRPGLRLSLRDALGFSWTRVYQPYQTQPILSQPQSITPKAQQAQQVVTNTPPVVSKPVVPQLQPVVTKTPPVASRPIVPQLQPVVPQVQPVVSQLNTPRSALPSPAVASNHFENIEIPYARSVEDNNASISSHGDAVDKPLPMKPIITSPSDLLLPHYDQSRSPKSPASFQKSPKSPKNHDEEHEDETNKTGKRNWKYFAKIANGLTQSTTSSTSGSEEQTHTNQSSRKGGSLPNSPSLKSPPRVPSGWVTHLDEPTQQWYFVNRFTNNSQWEVPTSAAKPVKLKESPRPDTPASSKTRKSSKAPNARIARFEENYPSWAI